MTYDVFKKLLNSLARVLNTSLISHTPSATAFIELLRFKPASELTFSSCEDNNAE